MFGGEFGGIVAIACLIAVMGLAYVSFFILWLIFQFFENFFQNKKNKKFAADRAAMVAELEKILDKLDKK